MNVFRKQAFTLVEMLIVVVIIGILAAAILPRINGYMARTRDLKRQMDLRNIAIAVQSYKDQYGSFHKRDIPHDYTELYWGSLCSYDDYCGSLSKPLLNYLNSIPLDPQKSSIVYDIFHGYGTNTEYAKHFLGGAHHSISSPGAYYYLQLKKGNVRYGAALLLAKVETADFANYVKIKDQVSFQGGKFPFPIDILSRDIEEVQLCTSIVKVKKGEEKFEVKGNGTVECAYSNAGQLYYIVKI